jgi:hypothetical protein
MWSRGMRKVLSWKEETGLGLKLGNLGKEVDKRKDGLKLGKRVQKDW